MRIISQDGTFDIPYEQVIIQRFKNEIYCLNANLTGVQNVVEDYKIAEYSTKEKAIKSVEMLREKYMKHYLTGGGVSTTANCYAQPFGFIPPKVFQFPKDDEIEV